MQAARGHSGGVGGAGLTEEQRLRIAANRQKALDKRASKSAGAPGPLALAALPHVGGGADGVATAVLVPGEQQMAGGAAAGAQHGLRLADALATASDSDRAATQAERRCDVEFAAQGLLGMVLEELAGGAGVFVECVDAGGQAESAGVRAGWTLAAINRQAVACLSLDRVMDLLGSCGRPLQLSFGVGAHVLPRDVRVGGSGTLSVEPALGVAARFREPPRYFRSTCRHVIRSVRPRPRVHGKALVLVSE
jgi:hypothetical protein